MSLVPLSEVCDITAGQSAPQDSDAFGPEGHPFIRAGSLEALTNGGSENDCEHLTEKKAQQYRMRLFPKDTIVFAKSGMSAKIGRVYRLKAPAYIVSHLAAVTPREDVDPSYLQRWFERNPPSRLIPNEAYPSIRTSEIGTLKIDLPKKIEQNRIADILEKADAIRRKRQQAIQLADEFLRSIFLDMFGDPATNPKQFVVRKLSEFYINEREGTKCGPFGSALKKHEYSDAGIPVWNMDNISLDGKFIEKVNLWITQDKYEELLPYSTKNGDVLISRAGTVGKMCVLMSCHENSLISTNLIRVRFNSDLLPIYFVSLMNYCTGRVGRLKTGARWFFYTYEYRDSR